MSKLEYDTMDEPIDEGRAATRVRNRLNAMACEGWVLDASHVYQAQKHTWLIMIFAREVNDVDQEKTS